MINIILSAIASIILIFKPVTNAKVLSQVNYSLANRYTNSYVNSVFADNILLTLTYATGKVRPGTDVAWNKVRNTESITVILKPEKTFAFHDTILEKYKGKVESTTNSHFNSSEGFKSDGWLVGDGVCHLASFMYVASKAAGLTVEAPTRHDFARIYQVAKKDGVSIFSGSDLQNLYITNNRSKTIAFVFTKKKDLLNIKVEELK